jgi:hypothetical protein
LEEQFGFLQNKQIHEAVGATQEGVPTIKFTKLLVVVMKVDLAKAYNKVHWLYLKLCMI